MLEPEGVGMMIKSETEESKCQNFQAGGRIRDVAGQVATIEIGKSAEVAQKLSIADGGR